MYNKEVSSCMVKDTQRKKIGKNNRPLANKLKNFFFTLEPV